MARKGCSLDSTAGDGRHVDTALRTGSPLRSTGHRACALDFVYAQAPMGITTHDLLPHSLVCQFGSHSKCGKAGTRRWHTLHLKQPSRRRPEVAGHKLNLAGSNAPAGGRARFERFVHDTYSVMMQRNRWPTLPKDATGKMAKRQRSLFNGLDGS